MTIDLNKKYRTRDGREVRLYATDGNGLYPVHGAIHYGEKWEVCGWDSKGRYFGEPDSSFDLLEAPKPRIKLERWANVYSEQGETPRVAFHPTEEQAKALALPPLIARVRVVIDCEEGEGL